ERDHKAGELKWTPFLGPPAKVEKCSAPQPERGVEHEEPNQTRPGIQGASGAGSSARGGDGRGLGQALQAASEPKLQMEAEDACGSGTSVLGLSDSGDRLHRARRAAQEDWRANGRARFFSTRVATCELSVRRGLIDWEESPPSIRRQCELLSVH